MPSVPVVFFLFTVIFFFFLFLLFSGGLDERWLCFFLISSDGGIAVLVAFATHGRRARAGAKDRGVAVRGACHRRHEGTHVGERFATFCAVEVFRSAGASA